MTVKRMIMEIKERIFHRKRYPPTHSIWKTMFETLADMFQRSLRYKKRPLAELKVSEIF